MFAIRWCFWKYLFKIIQVLTLFPTVASLSALCVSHSQCPHDMFCSITLQKTTGTCNKCWKCCIYPNIYGNCSSKSKCACRIGQQCLESSHCVNGLDCKSGKCQPKFNTFSEMFNYFEEENTSLPIHNVAYNKRCGNVNDTRISKVSQTQAFCPCNDNLISCPSGFKCNTIQTGILNEQDSFDQPLLWSTQAICVPCSTGEYCPQGTMTYSSLDCPVGFYCPNTTVAIECEPGTFCKGRTIDPQPCDTSSLLLMTKELLIKGPNVLDMVMRGDLSLRGNFCPLNAVTPLDSCPAGYFCPNTSIAIVCPHGFFCKQGSTNPYRCSSLSDCPIGTPSHPWNWWCVIFIIGLVCIVGLCTIIRNWKQITQTFSKHHQLYEEILTPDDIIYSQAVLTLQDIAYNVTSEATISTQQETLPRDIQDIVNERKLDSIQVIELYVQPDKFTKPWLWPISCRFKPNAINAIMGSSGCGKSTLLDLLRGRIPNAHINGSINIQSKYYGDITVKLPCIGKSQGAKSITTLKEIKSHVPQDDICCPDLTVEENIIYSILLHGHNSDQKLKMSTKDFVIDALQLNEFKSNIVGSVDQRGISGGQRKRVSIGMALVTLPSLLLMDEPTSGLDSTGCQTLLTLCKKLTTMGITIISILHQPRYSSFMLVDEIMFLSKYGTIFFGSPTLAIMYFHRGLRYSLDINENPADALMDIITKDQKCLVDTWKKDLLGFKWVTECNKMNLALHEACNVDIHFEQNTKRKLASLLADIRHDLTIDGNVQDVNQVIFLMFKHLRISCDIQSIESFLNAIKTKYKIQIVNDDHILTAFDYICTTAVLEKTYDNILEKTTLFSNIPEHIHSDPNDVPHIRVMFLVKMFINKLSRHSGLINNNQRKANYKSIFVLEKEVLLASLYLKIGLGFNSYDEQTQYDFIRLDNDYQHLQKYYRDIIILLKRRTISIWRSPWGIQVIIPMCAAVIVGLIHGSNWGMNNFPGNIVMAFACLGVLSTITHIRTFSLDKQIISRDTDGMVSILSYFIAYNLTDFIWIVCMPLSFCLPYALITMPMSGFIPLYIVGLFTCWWSSGIAYLLSTLPIALHWLNILAAFIGVIFGAFINGLNPTIASASNNAFKIIMNISYNRWVLEYLSIEEFSQTFYQETNANLVWAIFTKIGICGKTIPFSKEKNVIELIELLKRLQTKKNIVLAECDSYLQDSILMLLLLGCIFRILACILMMIQNSVFLKRVFWHILNWKLKMKKREMPREPLVTLVLFK